MPGKKRKFSAKEDRMAKHVAASEKKRGMSPKEAKAVGYATVNKHKKSSKKKMPMKKGSKKMPKGMKKKASMVEKLMHQV